MTMSRLHRLTQAVLPKAAGGISLGLLNSFPKSFVPLCCLGRRVRDRATRSISIMEVEIWYTVFSHGEMTKKNS